MIYVSSELLWFVDLAKYDWINHYTVHFRVTSCDLMSCFLVSSDVFGPCCVQISVEPHQSSSGSGPRPHEKVRLGLLDLMVAFTLIQMNHTYRAITPEFVLFKKK